MRLLVCGDRDWTDGDLIGEWLDHLRPSVVIEGEARGADRLAAEAAALRGIEVAPYPADWAKHKRAAGPIRNRQMLKEGRPDRVLAFHDDIGRSRGTADMIEAALAAGLPVTLISHEGATPLRSRHAKPLGFGLCDN